MKTKIHVVPQDGKWALSSSSKASNNAGLFNTKSEAIMAARNASSYGKIIVHTSTGQVIRTPTLKTSRDAELMREAVMKAVHRLENRQG